MDDHDRRVKFLFRPRNDVLEDIDVTILNSDDEGDRRLLIASEHPRFWEAIEEGNPEIEIGDEPVNGELHLAMHEIVANRILADTPPEFWETARRLTRQGYRRHDVLHMLGQGDQRRGLRRAEDGQNPYRRGDPGRAVAPSRRHRT